MPETGALVPIVAIAAWYVAATTRAWQRLGRGRVVSVGECTAFLAGCALAAVALVGPIDAQADRSLSMHMTQHVILIAAAAPLLALGAPFRLTRWGWGTERIPERVLPRARLSGGRWLSTTAIAVVGYVAAITIWHLPGPFEAAVRNPALHAGEHATLVIAAFGLWWAVLSAGGRSHWGVGVLTLFIVSLPMTILGAVMTFAHTPWYPSYHSGATSAALNDQQLAGVIMWGFGGLLMLIGAMILFARWLGEIDRLTPQLFVGADRAAPTAEPGR